MTHSQSSRNGSPEGSWAADELRHLAGVHELEIARVGADGGAGRWTPIWVVVVGNDVFVRTWQRRETGWYGHAVRSGRLWVRSPRERLVAVETTGDDRSDRVDAEYRRKYGVGGAESMVTAEAAASTLRLAPLA